MIENRWGGHGLLERQIAEAGVVADVDGGAGVEQLRQKNVGGELFGRRNRPAGVAAEVGLQIKEPGVGEGGVVIDDHPQGQFLGELIDDLGAQLIIIENRLARRKIGGRRSVASAQAVVDAGFVDAKARGRPYGESKIDALDVSEKRIEGAS